MASFIKFFDIFGNGFTPTVGYSSKKESSLGGVFGIIFFVFGIYLIYDFGRNIINKKVPITSQAIDVDLYNSLNLTMPFAFEISAKSDFGYHVENQTKADNELKYLNANLNRLLEVSISYLADNIRNRLNMKKCNLTRFGDYIHPDNETISSLNCTDVTDSKENILNLTGKSGDPSHKEIQYLIWECDNTTSNNSCFSETEMNYYFDNYKFKQTIYYPGLIFDPSNYLDPFKYYVEFQEFYLLHGKLTIKRSLNILNFILDTDIGLFYEYDEYLETQKLESYENHVLYNTKTSF